MSLIDTIVLMVLCVSALSPLLGTKADGPSTKVSMPVMLLFAVIGVIGLGHGLIRLLQAVPVLDVLMTSVLGIAELASWLIGGLIGLVLIYPLVKRLTAKSKDGVDRSRFQVPLGIAGFVVFAVLTVRF